uniref:Chromo domain-containing protein n=1 Tax=Bracon brevicornis TaxID=1563983 RepID=A0A6V7KS66_9HYME
MEPAAVTLDNAYIAVKNIEKSHEREDKKRRQPRMFKYKVNDYVRISKHKGVFAKGYKQNWSNEIFKIIRARERQALPTYEIEDLSGEEIDGYFYEEKLTLVNKNIENEAYEIEQVLKTRGKGKNRQVFVKWVGYPAKFNSWIPASDVENIVKNI